MINWLIHWSVKFYGRSLISFIRRKGTLYVSFKRFCRVYHYLLCDNLSLTCSRPLLTKFCNIYAYYRSLLLWARKDLNNYKLSWCHIWVLAVSSDWTLYLSSSYNKQRILKRYSKPACIKNWNSIAFYRIMIAKQMD